MADPDLTVPVCIVTGFGINTDREMAHAFALAGGHPVRLHVNDLIADPARLAGFRIFVLPGGFSFGDHVGSGAMLAALMARTLRASLAAFVARGGLVLGVCNGFQVLARMGLVPAAAGWSQSVALVHNASGRFEDRWVRVAFDPAAPCVWTRGIAALPLPVRHGEGRLVAPGCVLQTIETRHLGVARYVAPDGRAGRARGAGALPGQPQWLAAQSRRPVRPQRPRPGPDAAPRGVPAPVPPPLLAQRPGHPRRRRAATVPQRRTPRTPCVAAHRDWC